MGFSPALGFLLGHQESVLEESWGIGECHFVAFGSGGGEK